MNLKPIFSTLLSSALFSLMVGSSFANTLTYPNDKAGFLIATGATSIGPLPSNGSNGTIIGTATFTSANSIIFGDWSNEITGFDLAISGGENFNLSIAGGAYSVGFDLHEPTTAGSPPGCNAAVCVDSPFTIQIFFGSTSLGIFQYNAPDDNSTAIGGPLGFFGVHSSSRFDRVEIRDVNDNLDNEYFGNFMTGQTALPVNEPSKLLLFVVGLGAFRIAMLGRKAKQRQYVSLQRDSDA
jgi:hypothetical protein